MSKKSSEKEIEEAHRQVRGEQKEEKKPVQKKDSEKLEKTLEKNGVRKESEKSEAKSAEEHILAEQEQKGKGPDLEEITRKARPLPAELHDSQYVEQLSHKPIGEIYQEIKDIYKSVEDKGYLSTLEQKQVLYLNSAVERKIEAEEHGTYSFSEEAARAASVTQQLSATMIGSYKGKKHNEMYRS